MSDAKAYAGAAGLWNGVRQGARATNEALQAVPHKIITRAGISPARDPSRNIREQSALPALVVVPKTEARHQPGLDGTHG